MFRKGGSAAKGSGIEAGLTHRKRFAGGDLATQAATGDNDIDLSRIENMDFTSDDTSDFDDYMLAHAYFPMSFAKRYNILPRGKVNFECVK